jgi:ParB/RepB/Spo0J family partition protein
MTETLQNILLTEILYDDEFNCRGVISPMDVAGLAKDIERDGLLQPIGLSLLGEPVNGCKYKLLMGHRRYRAHQILKRDTIKAVVRDEVVSELDARVLNLKENVNRKQLNLYQEAMAMKPMTDLGLTETQVAERLGASRGWVQVRFMLLKLPEEIQQEAAAGWLTQGAIRDIYSHYKSTGDKEVAFQLARDFKDAKIKGKPNFRKKVKKKTVATVNTGTKKYRERHEIEQLQEYFFEQMGKATVANRVLAWAAGHISTDELHISIKEFADENNLRYRIP